MHRARRRSPLAQVRVPILLAGLVLVWACGDGPQEPATATLVVATITTGDAADLDSDGYELTGLGGGPVKIGARDTVTLDGLTPGSRTLTLSGIAANCEATSGTTRTLDLPANDTAHVQFALTCGVIPAALDVTFTTPADAALGSIVIQVDGGAPVRLVPGDRISLDSMSPGAHSVQVIDGTPNCRTGSATRTISLVRAVRSELAIVGACSAGHIVFGRGGRLILMNADSSGQHDITPAGMSAYEPALSPDGARVAFVAGGHLYVMRSDGTGATPIETTLINLKEPIWAPDGTRLAFSAGSLALNDYEVFVIDADGANLRNVTNSPYRDECPSWSPDGARLAFTSDRNGVDPFIGGDLMIVDLASGAVQSLGKVGVYPSWAPDGSTIAVRAGGMLALVKPDGTGLRSLPSPVYVNYPRWSPDGRLLVSYANEGTVYFTSVLDGSTTVPLAASGAQITQATWGR